METQEQLKQLKLNVTNIKSVLIKKNENRQKSEKKDDDQEKRKLSIKKKQEEEKKLTAGTSSLKKMASSVKGAIAKPGGSLFDKMMDFGLIVLTGILVNALPAIKNKLEEIFTTVGTFISPIVDTIQILINAVSNDAGNVSPELEEKQVKFRQDIERAKDDLLEGIRTKLGPLGGLVSLLEPLINDLTSKFGAKLKLQTGGATLTKNEAGEEGIMTSEGRFVKSKFTEGQRRRFEKGDTRAYIMPEQLVGSTGDAASSAAAAQAIAEGRDDHGSTTGGSDPTRQRFSLPTTPGQTTSLPANVTGFNAGTKGNTGTLIYLHWTAGDYNSNGSYHTVFAGDGKAKRNSSYDDYSIGHTEGKNTNAVGLSIAAAKGASDLNRMGSHPPTQAQLNAMTAEAARLAIAWGWKESDIDKNVWTHAEAGSGLDPRGLAPHNDDNGDGRPDNYGPKEWGGNVARWDLYGLRKGAANGSGGPELRDMIKQHYRRFKKGQTVSRADHSDAQISPIGNINLTASALFNQPLDDEGGVFAVQPIVKNNYFRVG